jgi:cysteine synthase
MKLGDFDMHIISDASELIGSTPLMELKNVITNPKCRILAKLELCNPTSIKDRAVLNMIRTAFAEDKITTGCEVVEASSGNRCFAHMAQRSF